VTPRVSVLVLAYNHGPYLSDTLDSILKQEMDFPFEILVGEDCSTDDTLRVAERYRDAHPDVIQIITSSKNVGMYENFRRLTFAARGEYIAICEGDDYWNACDKLSLQTAELDRHPAASLVHSDFDHIVEVDGHWRALPYYWRHQGSPIPSGSVFDELLVRNFIKTCTMMARASHMREFFASPLPLASYRVLDWPLCLFLALRGEVTFIDASLSTYRRVAGSATNLGHAADLARARSHFAMGSDFCRFAARPDLEAPAHQAAMGEALLHAVLDRDLGEVRAVLDWFKEAPPGPRTWKTAAGRAAVRTRIGMRALAPVLRRMYRLRLSEYDARPVAPGKCT
jgi:hypothetical protein